MSKKLEWKTALGFDFGAKNIGVAAGQCITRTANALPALKAKDGIPEWKKVSLLIDDWKPDIFIVGMPFNMDGSLSPMALRARKFGNRLTARYNTPWYPVDERLSTREAKAWAYKTGHKGDFANNPVDSLSAQLILEYWMNSQDSP